MKEDAVALYQPVDFTLGPAARFQALFVTLAFCGLAQRFVVEFVTHHALLSLP
jgi:hypothetical protein